LDFVLPQGRRRAAPGLGWRSSKPWHRDRVGGADFAYAFGKLGRAPTAGEVLAAGAMLLGALLVSIPSPSWCVDSPSSRLRVDNLLTSSRGRLRRGALASTISAVPRGVFTYVLLRWR